MNQAVTNRLVSPDDRGTCRSHQSSVASGAFDSETSNSNKEASTTDVPCATEDKDVSTKSRQKEGSPESNSDTDDSEQSKESTPPTDSEMENSGPPDFVETSKFFRSICDAIKAEEEQPMMEDVAASHGGIAVYEGQPPAYVPEEAQPDESQRPRRSRRRRSGNVEAEVAKVLLYKPSGKWAQWANEPITDDVQIAQLNGGRRCEVYLKEGTLGGQRITYISKTWKLDDKWEDLFTELALYSEDHLLRPLQGDIVPTVLGVYVETGQISVAMALPESKFWMTATEDMPDTLKRKFVKAYDTIHDRGILQKFVKLSNMLIGSNGEVMIINFHASRAVTPNNGAKLRGCTQDLVEIEARKIRYKLNYGASRKYENDKRRRVFDRIDMNGIRMQISKLIEQGERTGDVPEYVPEHPDDYENPIVSSDGRWVEEWVADYGTGKIYLRPGLGKEERKTALITFIEEMVKVKVNEVGVSGEEWKRRRKVKEEVVPLRTEESPRSDRKRERAQRLVDSWKKRYLDTESTVDTESQQGSQQPPLPNPTALPDGTNEISQEYIEQGFSIDPINPVITVPYEGYTGPGGTFTFANHYTPQMVGSMRKTWISMACVEQARVEGLPYSAAQKMGLTSTTDGSGDRARRVSLRKEHGIEPGKSDESAERKWRKNVTRSVALGGLRRKVEEAERGDTNWNRWVDEMWDKKHKYLRYRCFDAGGVKLDGYEHEDYSEFIEEDNPTSRARKILPWDEYANLVGESNAKHIPEEGDVPPLKWDRDAKPKKSCLRVKISEGEAFANRVVKDLLETRLRKDLEMIVDEKDAAASRQQRGSGQENEPMSNELRSTPFPAKQDDVCAAPYHTPEPDPSVPSSSRSNGYDVERGDFSLSGDGTALGEAISLSTRPSQGAAMNGARKRRLRESDSDDEDTRERPLKRVRTPRSTVSDHNNDNLSTGPDDESFSAIRPSLVLSRDSMSWEELGRNLLANRTPLARERTSETGTSPPPQVDEVNNSNSPPHQLQEQESDRVGAYTDAGPSWVPPSENNVLSDTYGYIQRGVMRLSSMFFAE